MGKNKIRAFVTGGLSGIGKEIVKYFPGSTGVSRTNGYDIKDESVRANIIEELKSYNVFINLAHDGVFAQTRLLYEVFESWQDTSQKRYIINIGSIASAGFNNDEYRRFAIVKYALDTASLQCAKKIRDQGLNLRCTVIRPGLLDIEKSREKKIWKGVGVRGETLAKTIEFLWKMPSDQQITEFIVEPVHINC